MKTALQELIDYAIDKYGRDSNAANDLICQAMILKKKNKLKLKTLIIKLVTQVFLMLLLIMKKIINNDSVI